jgi:hypothetical protein
MRREMHHRIKQPRRNDSLDSYAPVPASKSSVVAKINHHLVAAAGTQVLLPPRARPFQQFRRRLDELLEMDGVGVRDAGEVGIQSVLLVRVPKCISGGHQCYWRRLHKQEDSNAVTTSTSAL